LLRRIIQASARIVAPPEQWLQRVPKFRNIAFRREADGESRAFACSSSIRREK